MIMSYNVFQVYKRTNSLETNNNYENVFIKNGCKRVVNFIKLFNGFYLPKNLMMSFQIQFWRIILQFPEFSINIKICGKFHIIIVRVNNERWRWRKSDDVKPFKIIFKIVFRRIQCVIWNFYRRSFPKKGFVKQQIIRQRIIIQVYNKSTPNVKCAFVHHHQRTKHISNVAPIFCQGI